MHTWLHMANSLRCGMTYAAITRYVFVIQDDTQMHGPVNMTVLSQLLLRPRPADPPIEYVKFYMYPDCRKNPIRPGSKQMIMGAMPCTRHPSTPYLHFSVHWQDRPHFATRAHYEDRLFRTLPPGAKVTPEQYLDIRSRNARDWGIWTYGLRGDMLRELHAPVRINGTLITREFVVSAQQRGELDANITVPYVHSYLVHAYAGATQDFDTTLKKAKGEMHNLHLRTRNPLWMDDEDKRWGGLDDERVHHGVPRQGQG